MKYFVLLVLCSLSCSGFNKPINKAQPNSDQFLYWCEQAGIWPVHATAPKNCEKVSRGTWDHLPVIVNAEDDLILETLLAIESFNDQVGFELFKFEIGNVDPDIVVFAAGKHGYAAAEAKQTSENGRRYAGILVYNGLEKLDREDIMVHELGHLVGLKHDHGNKHSIMFPSATYRVARLEPQDVKALRAVYLK